MASYHLSVKNISRGAGQSSVASAAYRATEKLHDDRNGLDFDYSRKSGLGHSEIMAPENAPEWMKDRSELWNAVESAEKRKDARLAKEVEVALPRELSLEQQKDLIREFSKRNFIDKGMVADINIHLPENNPHAHIMLTTREITPDGFGGKVREWNDRNLVFEWRKNWAEIQNEHLLKNGYDVTVDHRSHAERGIDVEPQIHLGPIGRMEPDETKDLDRMREHERISRENGERIIENPNIALELLSRQQATFTLKDIWRFANSHSVDNEQFQRVKSAIENSFELVRLGTDERDDARFTTQSMLEAEKKTFEDAKALSETSRHRVQEAYIDQSLRTRTLTNEQERAFREIVTGGDLSSMIGRAGTGKSYTLDAVRESFEAQGFTVRGAALSGIAAEGLEESSGIRSQTAHRTLWEWANGRNLLNDRSVLVIDEAGMIGTRQMHGIIEHARQAGAKVVLVGDEQQLQPIEAGGVFRGIVERHGASELTEIRRQRTEWQKEATSELARGGGEVGRALDRYMEHGNIKTVDTIDHAKEQLIQDWKQHREESTLILAYRKKDVADLNQRARVVLKEAGSLGLEERTFETVRGSLPFAENDRIMFLRNERSLGVKNGTLGSVENVEPNGLLVKLDNGSTVAFDAGLYRDFDYGYAATIHKTQGVTIDRSFVLGSAHFDKHLAYVALSRHREDVTMYTSRDGIGFKDSDHMKAVMGRERPKGLVIDYANSRGIGVDLGGKGHLFSPELIPEADKSERVSEIRGLALQKGYTHRPAELEKEVQELARDGNFFRRLQGGLVETELAFEDYKKGFSVENRAEELERFKREINLSEYAASKGYAIDPVGTYRNVVTMRRENDKIGISRDGEGHYVYYNWQEERGGSVIDFVQRTEGKNLGEVRKELRPWIGENEKPVIVPVGAYREHIEPVTEDREGVLKTFQGTKAVTKTHGYLESRHISKDTLSDGRFRGKVYADSRGNAIFPHIDREGLSGFDIRNFEFKGFSKGGQKGIWGSCVYKEDNRLVITEGAIDALSYHQLKGDDHTCYLAISGNMSDKQRELVGAAMQSLRGISEIVIATDNDKGGDRLASELREIADQVKDGRGRDVERPDEGRNEDLTITRDVPKEGKDWNEELKEDMKLEHEHGKDEDFSMEHEMSMSM